MPISFFEGIPEDQRVEMGRRNMERRFFALAAAVRLRQICGEPGTGEMPAA